MSKKRLLSALLAVIIVILPLSSCRNKNTWFEFRYQSGNSDYMSEMYYDDSLFDSPSNVYNPSLATASLSFAMSSFASALAEYPDKSRNACELLDSLGYSDIDVNKGFEEKPGTDTLGCVFGCKQIGDVLMIACGIRGSNYESEWASNFTIGNNEKYHQGFYEGSEIFLESLREYIKDKNISGKIGLWVVGYSRAGAVCNISAGRIDEAIASSCLGELLGEGISLSRDDLYAFCFEPPRGVKYDESLYPKSELFNNIFNIVNHNDVVQMIVMDYFHFTRYGVDKILFDNMNDPDYSDDIRIVTDYFARLENSDILGEYAISKFEMKRLSGFKTTGSEEYINWSQGIFLEDFITHVAQYGIVDVSKYLEKMEEGLRDIFSFVYLKGGASASFVDLGISMARDSILSYSADLLLDDLLHNQSKIMTDFRIALTKALSMLNVDIDVQSVSNAVEGLLTSLTSSLLHDFEFGMLLPLLSKENITAIGQAHRPEVTLAFLRSLDPKYTKNAVDYDMSGRYYYVEIDDTTADVSLTCNGKEIAKFEGGKPQKTDSSIPYGRHRKLRIYLPYNGEYEIYSSSEKISVTLYEPSVLKNTDCGFEISQKDNTYFVLVTKTSEK